MCEGSVTYMYIKPLICYEDINDLMLTDINECEEGDPCHGRTCINYEGGGFECICFVCDCLSVYPINEFCDPGEFLVFNLLPL